MIQTHNFQIRRTNLKTKACHRGWKYYLLNPFHYSKLLLRNHSTNYKSDLENCKHCTRTIHQTLPLFCSICVQRRYLKTSCSEDLFFVKTIKETKNLFLPHRLPNNTSIPYLFQKGLLLNKQV